MRLFVCTWLDPDNQAFYGRQMADLTAPSGGLLRAIPPDSAHITYAFLPRVADVGVGDVARAVADVATRHAPVSIRLGPSDILFARAEARLVYAPLVHGANAIVQLGADVVAELQQRLPGVEISAGRSPHVTLARFRKHTRRGSARAVLKTLADQATGYVARADRIGEIHLVGSELTATGPRYVTVSRVPLGGGKN